MIRLITLLCLLLCLMASCENTPSPDEEKPAKADSTETGYDTIHVSTVYHTVAEAQLLFQSWQDTILCVKGYIVGDLNGMSLSTAQFSPPFTSESNLLLADDSMETNASACFPVSLKAGTAMRAALSLKAHPENLHRRVVVLGCLSAYFRTAGMKTTYDYEFLSSASPVTPEPVDTGFISIPINQKGEVCYGGRLLPVH